MEEPEKPSNWMTRDATIPLLLSGVFSTVACIGLCVVLYLSRDFINNDLAPRMGWVEPTPAPVMCPPVPQGWRQVMNNDFDANEYGWPLEAISNDFSDSELTIEGGMLHYDVLAKQGVFASETPVSKSVRDFYLSSTVQKVEGPLDAEYGIVFRKLSRRLFFFTIQDNGRVKVHFRDGANEWQDIRLNTYTPNVHAGEKNELIVFSQDDHVVLCVNQFVVGEMDIPDYQYGEIGIGVDIENAGEHAVVEYDDLIVYEP